MIPLQRLAVSVAFFVLAAIDVTSAGEVSKIAVADGKHISCEHSHDLFERDDEIRHAVIVIHGVRRNSGTYFKSMIDAVTLSNLQRETLVVAPGFKVKEEADSDEFYFGSNWWTQGDLAYNGRGEIKVSSFDALDRLLAIVSDRSNFPSLKTVAIIGHSAGGQFVNRYVSAANLPQDRQTDFRFIVLNPSSYMYPDQRRFREGQVVGPDELSEEFPDYNHYRYGTDKLNTAMRRVGVQRIREQLVSRQCYYFTGSEDVKSYLLDKRPGAMVQGPSRFARFCSYRDFVARHEDARWRKNSRFMAVDGVGHNSREMFADVHVRNALFCDTKDASRDTKDALRDTNEALPDTNDVSNLSDSWSSELLDAARDYSKTLDTAAVVIMQHGRVVDQWGAVAMPLNCHSIRKSILSALYGTHVQSGTIMLDATMKQLGIDDNEPSLTKIELQATVGDLLKARSGIYHPALYETASMAARRPPRGSHAPNTFWYYNNWDFNALGTIFEKRTGESLFDAFETQFAKPLGMQDFRRDRDTLYVRGDDSIHPAYPFYLSARDLSKFGQLMLQRGDWAGQQLVPEPWVKESTASYSEAGSAGGYGYMWWVAANGTHLPDVSLPDGSFSARGNRGQYLVVIPDWDMVVCHRVNTFQKGTAVARSEFSKLLSMIIAASPQAAASPQTNEQLRRGRGNESRHQGLVASSTASSLRSEMDHRSTLDCLIKGGEVIDGTGRNRFRADVAIRDGRIVEVADKIEATAETTIDATGKLVCPGFIDLHSHAEKGLVSEDPARRSGPNLITQGITTVVVNQDGGGPLDLNEQRQTMQRLGVGLNVIQTLGHGTIRGEVMGEDHQRPASPAEISEMCQLLRAALQDGAFGMSAGLEYVPGRWSTPREMQALAQVVADADGVSIVHERSSGSRPMWFLPSQDAPDQPSMLDNLRELILIADITKVTTVATHIKARGTDFWGAAEAMNSLIRRARDEGLPVFADQYPYDTSGSDGRLVLIPGWVWEVDDADKESDTADYAAELNKILSDDSLADDLRRDIDFEIIRRGGAEKILVVQHRSEELVGKSLAELAGERKQTPVEVAIELQLSGDPEQKGGCRLRAFSMSEADVEAFAQTPWTATSSDAGITLPADGLVHPRFYGAFPRKIRRYAIDRKLISIEEAVRVSTSLPAEILGLNDRGVLRKNAVADLVVFDPLRIQDKADAFNPHQFSEGIDDVLVNGKPCVWDGQWLGCLAGTVLLRQDRISKMKEDGR